MSEATRTFSWRTLVALVMIPVLVAGGFLWGTWNSGDRLKQVEAAVVNLDEGVTIDDQFIPLGRQLSADLVDSSKDQNFTWVLADEAHAWPGLASGRYAAVVVIPENFSKAATSYGNDDPQTAEQATIAVHTSPVAGVADAWLGNVLANAASRSLNTTLTKAYLDQIYIGFNDTGKQFQTVADAAGKLSDGTVELSNGIVKASDGAGKLNAGLGQLADGMGQLKSKTSSLPADTKKLASGVSAYVDGANGLAQSTIDSLGDQVKLAAGIKQLSQGTSGLVSGLTTYQSTLKANAAASEKAAAGIEQLLQGVQTDPANYPLARDAIKEACQIETTPEKLATDGAACVGSLKGAAAALSGAADGLDTKDPDSGESLISGATKTAAGMSQLSDQVQNGLPDVDKTTKQLKELISGGKQLSSGTKQLADGMPALADGIAKLADGTAASATGTNELAKGLDQAADGSEQLADGTRKLADGLEKGAGKIPTFSKADRENLATVVADPVNTSGIDGVVTPTVSWVSLLIALALWLGALATFAVIKPLDGRLALSTASSATLIGRALLPGVIVAAAQAIVLTALGTAVLGWQLPKAAAVAGFLVLAGAAFVLVNHALAAWFGNAGRLIAIAFAVITTVGAVTSAVPGVFDTLRPLSPVSPALDGLRALMTDSTGAPAAIFTLLGWAVIALGASAAAVLRRRTVRLAELSALS
ncbi:MAG: YhgE/Pip domain-containing protein [Micropruina glycogenica]